MDPFGFTSEEEGIRSAERALDELRVLLHTTASGGRKTAPWSSWVPSIVIPRSDQDVALHHQLNNLEEMLRMISDSRFARGLIEDDNERAGVHDAEGEENVDLLRVIVSTVRDIMAFQTYRSFDATSDQRYRNGDRVAGSSGRSNRRDRSETPPSPLSEQSDDFETGSQAIPLAPSCTVCAEDLFFQTTGRLETPCGHFYCPRCVVDLVESYASQAFPSGPLRCCPAPQPPIPVRLVHRFIDETTRRIVEEKEVEANTPYDQRIYCPLEACRKFIDPARVTPAARASGAVICPNTTCRANICLECKQQQHRGVNCEKNADDKQAVNIQKLFGWGRCPGCGFVVEKIAGCSSVNCSRCGRNFTYQPMARN